MNGFPSSLTLQPSHFIHWPQLLPPAPWTPDQWSVWRKLLLLQQGDLLKLLQKHTLLLSK